MTVAGADRRLAPSILSADFTRLGEGVERVITAGAFEGGSAIFGARGADRRCGAVIEAMRPELEAVESLGAADPALAA